MRDAFYCRECNKPFVKVPSFQAHLISEHGQATRVCIQSAHDARLLGGQPALLSAPRDIAPDDRSAAVAAFKSARPLPLSCGLCDLKTDSYHTLKRHLASEHDEGANVCLARAYDDVVVGRLHISSSDVPRPRWMATRQMPEVLKQIDPVSEVPRVSSFGDANILPPPEKTKEEKAAEAAEIAAFINADKEKAYACPDDGPNRHYEAFEAGRAVAEMQSRWRDARGHPLFTHYREDETPIAFYYDHVSMEEMIPKIGKNSMECFKYFIRRLFDDPRNRLFYKRSPSYPLTDVHFGDGVWKICPDVQVYPRFVENAALAMRDLLGRFSQAPMFNAAFAGANNHNIVDHHMHIVCTLFHRSDLEAYYDRDMKRFYYGYIQATREAVAEYSETEEEPWNAYPIGSGAGGAASST